MLWAVFPKDCLKVIQWDEKVAEEAPDEDES